MKYTIAVIALLTFHHTLCAQDEARISRAKIVAGLSGPELIHAGVTYRICDFSQLGFNAGLGPSFGMLWSALSLEHRLYLGKNSARTNQKLWFFRQGTTWFPAETNPSQDLTLNLTVGKDIPFRNLKNGLTIDAGVFYLPDSETSSVILVRSWNLWPALRFEFYFSL
jgi:hypothetical protein